MTGSPPTYADLCDAVASCGLPYARVAWDGDDPSSVPALPHVLLVPEETDDVAADGTSLCEVTAYTVELYEHGSSLSTEARLERALIDAGFRFARRFVQVDAGVVEMAYHLSVLGR